MKKNIIFVSITACLLIASVLILMGCMHVIAAGTDTSKPYLSEPLNAVAESGEEPLPPTESITPPKGEGLTPQAALSEKFGAMASVDQGTNSITLVTQKFLDEYWQSSPTDEQQGKKLRSLTTEEVMFIIQDSIRIYFEYDYCVLIGRPAEDCADWERNYYAFNGSKVVVSAADKVEDLYYQVVADIHRIIVYRLAVLSSPEAFLTFNDVAELEINFEAEVELEYCVSAVEVLYYVPNLCTETDLGGIWKKLFLYNEPTEEVEVFKLINMFAPASISYQTADGEEEAFPTAELKRHADGKEVVFYDGNGIYVGEFDVSEEKFLLITEEGAWVYYVPSVSPDSIFMHNGKNYVYDSVVGIVTDLDNQRHVTLNPEEAERMRELLGNSTDVSIIEG